MSLVLVLVLASLVQSSPQAPAQELSSTVQPQWQKNLLRRHEALVRRNGPGTDKALRDQLIAMQAEDQAARGFHGGQPDDSKQVKIAKNLADVDKELTAKLKEIVAAKGWPTIALVGLDASNAAMLVLTHTSDHVWQGSLLTELEGLADTGKIDGSGLALVIDKELVARGQLQRYGSQFKFVNGEMAMFAVEDPAGLDRRRADALLPPMDVYRQMLMSMYHLKVSAQIVSATPEPAVQPVR